MKKQKVLYAVRLALIAVFVISFVLALANIDSLRTAGIIGLIVSVVGFVALAFVIAISKKQTGSAVDTKIKAKLKHVAGLPVVKDAFVDVYYTPQEIVFIKDGQTIKVSCEKVSDIDRISSKDTSSQIAGAAAGLFLFGVLGAAAGAAAEKFYIVISYQSDGEAKFISLEEGSESSFTKKMIAAYKADHPKENKVVEL